jgi:hypothetical protein
MLCWRLTLARVPLLGQGTDAPLKLNPYRMQNPQQ